MCERGNNEGVQYPCGCDDFYFYIIHAPQLAEIDSFYEGTGDNYNYNSLEVGIDREGGDTCDNGSDIALPEWEAGDEVECWRPSSPSEGVRNVYRCGNDECIKIFDPQDDIDQADTI